MAGGVQTAREALLAAALDDAGTLLERLEKLGQTLPDVADKTTADVGAAADKATAEIRAVVDGAALMIGKASQKAVAELQAEHQQYQKTLREAASALRTAAACIASDSKQLARKVAILGALAGALGGIGAAGGCLYLAKHFGVL